MRHSAFAVFCLAASLALGGCALSIPLPSLLADEDITASIASGQEKKSPLRQNDADSMELHGIAEKPAPSRR